VPAWRRSALAMAVVLTLLGSCGGDDTPRLDPDDPAVQALDQVAKEDLRTAIAATAVYYAEQFTYAGFAAERAAEIEMDLEWIEGDAPEPGQILIHRATLESVHLVAQSESGYFYCARAVSGNFEVAASGTGPTFGSVDDEEECAGPGF
jgi:hypothetical protein